MQVEVSECWRLPASVRGSILSRACSSLLMSDLELVKSSFIQQLREEKINFNESSGDEREKNSKSEPAAEPRRFSLSLQLRAQLCLGGR